MIERKWPTHRRVDAVVLHQSQHAADEFPVHLGIIRTEVLCNHVIICENASSYAAFGDKKGSFEHLFVLFEKRPYALCSETHESPGTQTRRLLRLTGRRSPKHPREFPSTFPGGSGRFEDGKRRETRFGPPASKERTKVMNSWPVTMGSRVVKSGGLCDICYEGGAFRAILFV